MYDSNDTLKMIYSDTDIPDIFISEYMPSLLDNQVKVYVYCCYLAKNHKNINEMVLANVFKMSPQDMVDLLYTLIESNLLSKNNTDYRLKDIKEIELRKLYKPRTAPLAEDLGKKKDIISSINKRFFQGVMPISWYTSIETMFKLHKFDDDVMYSLFSTCFERGKLKKAYIEEVARNWSENGVKTHFDLEDYYMKYKTMRETSTKVAKKLNRQTPLTQYEEKYVNKWVKDYGYSFDIIELALKNTTKINNPNLEYVHKILTTWYKNGYKTKEEIKKANRKYRENKTTIASQRKNDVKDYYEKIRNENLLVHKTRLQGVYKKIPTYQELETQMTELSISSLSANTSKKNELLAQIDGIDQVLLELLINNGFAKNYLHKIITCTKCRDTGVLPNGLACSCRKNIKTTS